MGRKKKDQQPKAPTEPTRTIEDLNEDDQRVLLEQHTERYELGLKAKKKADADFKNVCKKAKAEIGKRAVEMIKLAILLQSDEGKADFGEEMTERAKIARWMGVTVGTQFEFSLAEINHYEEGKRSGLKGESRKPPVNLAPGGDQYNDWIRGWDEGQAVITKGFKKPDEGQEEEDVRPRFKQTDAVLN